MINKKILTLGFSLLVLSGCETTGIMGGQGPVKVGDPAHRTHLTTELTAIDYLQFAENTTNKMLGSPLVQGWGSTKPKLIVGKLRNNTDNESIRMGDVHDRITETLFNSGLVRVVDKSATSFDYIIKSDINTTRQSDSKGRELVYYTLVLKMFTISGELKGQWSDDLPLVRS